MDNHFVADFLQWYQRRFAVSTVQSDLELVDLVQKAEQIHVERIKQLEKSLHMHRENDLKMFKNMVDSWKKTGKIPDITITKRKKNAVSKKKRVKIQKY